MGKIFVSCIYIYVTFVIFICRVLGYFLYKGYVADTMSKKENEFLECLSSKGIPKVSFMYRDFIFIFIVG